MRKQRLNHIIGRRLFSLSSGRLKPSMGNTFRLPFYMELAKMENNFCPHCGADLRTTKLCVEDELDNETIAFGCFVVFLELFIGILLAILFA